MRVLITARSGTQWEHILFDAYYVRVTDGNGVEFEVSLDDYDGALTVLGMSGRPIFADQDAVNSYRINEVSS